MPSDPMLRALAEALRDEDHKSTVRNAVDRRAESIANGVISMASLRPNLPRQNSAYMRRRLTVQWHYE